MLYVSSNSTADGRFTIAVTFDLGTNLDIAQVQVQNRVGIAQPRLPADVRQIGVTVNKSSPDLMMVVHLYSPDKSRDTLFISNYADARDQGRAHPRRRRRLDHRVRQPRLRDAGLARSRPAAVARPDRERRHAGAAGPERPGRRRACSISRRSSEPGAFQVAVKTLGRLADPDEFANIVVKQTPTAVVRLKDVAKVELAALGLFVELLSQSRSRGRARGVPASRLERAVRPRKAIRATMDELSKRFPPGVKHAIIYDPTQFIQQSVEEVQETIGEAILLVVLVVILFLQTWRAAIIPLVAIPVSLIGTFFFMALFGFTLNNLSLFGLVLAVGIVVDDAIVVVENVERNIAAGLRAARGRHQEHGRGRRGADRDRAGAVRGVRAGGASSPAFPASSTGSSRSPSRARPSSR